MQQDGDDGPSITGGRNSDCLRVLRKEEREEFEQLEADFRSGRLVPLGSLCDVKRRVLMYLKHKYFPGRDRFDDADWMIASELNGVRSICEYYARKRHLSMVRADGGGQLASGIDVDEAA